MEKLLLSSKVSCISHSRHRMENHTGCLDMEELKEKTKCYYYL